jgi:DNA-directed RNA polymerase specialized sigma24 family protein
MDSVGPTKPTKPTKEQMRAAYEVAMVTALVITRSKVRAEEAVQDAFERLLTTRRWDPSKGSLERHMAGIVRSLLSISFHAAEPRKKAAAEVAFQDEVVGRTESPFETAALEAKELSEQDARSERQLERLRASVAHHPLASAVLRCHVDGIVEPRRIARALGVSNERVHRANTLLRSYRDKIREAE